MTYKFSLKLTTDAKKDLINIRQYTLEHWGKQQSTKYLSELRRTIRLLTETPSMGIKRPDIGNNIFSFPHVSHMLYYTLNANQLVVFAVLQQSMIPSIHLQNRES